MTATKLFPSGAWEISMVTQGQLFTRRYFGYTKREAISEFRADLKDAKEEHRYLFSR